MNTTVAVPWWWRVLDDNEPKDGHSGGGLLAEGWPKTHQRRPKVAVALGIEFLK